MKWRIGLMALSSAAMMAFPQNIIGCGGGEDPYNYYTSFFHNNLPEPPGYQPFYYTGYNFLYDEQEPVNLTESLAKEWALYCGKPVTVKDASRFVNSFAWKDLNTLYFHLEKNQPLKIPDSVKQNGMTTHFLRSRDLEGLGYLMFAKKVEPFATADTWEPLNRDSLKMDRLLKGGQQLYNAAKLNFYKLKYAYQVLRLAHYSGRYKDVIRLYDEYQPVITAANYELQPLCLALKAGALFRTGEHKEAAYLFSKVFSATTNRRISNFLGFSWSIRRSEKRESYLSLCKNNAERAAMLAMFSLGDPGNELATLKEIYQLQPDAPILEVLVVREINKLEEKYLTPQLQKQPGGRVTNEFWINAERDSTELNAGREAQALHGLLHQMAVEKAGANSGLFETAAAYTAYIIRDFATAKRYATAAKKLPLSSKVSDQLMLTEILIAIGEKSSIDAAAEAQLLPALQWLHQKAKAEQPTTINYFEDAPWHKFYRNLMSQVLAKRYYQQGDRSKELLCIGAADKMLSPGYGYGDAITYMQDKFSSADIEKLFALLEKGQPTAFERFLLGNNSITKAAVVDVAGTASLREYQYDKAIAWFSKATDKKALTIRTNPFIELLYDREERLPSEAKFTTDKLAFAREMKKLQQLAASDKANAAKHYYRYALGLYNMTYYGHAWQLVQYGRSGSDGYYIPKNATAFEREYYGCFAAQEHFKKAMDASTDNNFKARCLFMMAKCSQKQVQRPRYEFFTGDKTYELYEAAEKAYWPQFKNNSYFPELMRQYRGTPFYKEAFNSCSYLRDFVQRR